MPPQQSATSLPPSPACASSLSKARARRLLSSCLTALSALTLVGCAATQPEQHAQPSRLIRDSYLSRTQADPLGAYLASKEFSNRYANDTYPASIPVSPNKILANAALDHLGVKYKYGGDEPNTGFDCSGLITYAAEHSLGLKLPRRSRDIARLGKAVERAELKKGDLVFFNTLGSRFSHVGIYLGDQQFVHAPRSGAVVRIENMNTNYWQKRYNGARRLDIDALQTASLSR
ncbi:C40 family peptidase [Pusillimonas sp. CC-YST705]|uniref:C40 family peptidase n=1 Tax=Mesopusillimonas faecipullorum TaxID=2755040 RepID=A0ABS8C9L6_9BURK|nr:C40 family peptidase [Mesopusillimonas faecipullorum]